MGKDKAQSNINSRSVDDESVPLLINKDARFFYGVIRLLLFFDKKMKKKMR